MDNLVIRNIAPFILTCGGIVCYHLVSPVKSPYRLICMYIICIYGITFYLNIFIYLNDGSFESLLC